MQSNDQIIAVEKVLYYLIGGGFKMSEFVRM